VWAATLLPSFLNCRQQQADKDRYDAGVHNHKICHMNKYLRIKYIIAILPSADECRRAAVMLFAQKLSSF
jgi:hypothetical protein